MQSKGVQVLVVGVGSRVGNSKLQNIAMGKTTKCDDADLFRSTCGKLEKSDQRHMSRYLCKLILKLLHHVDVSDFLFYLFCIFSLPRCGIEKSKYNVKKHQ